MGSRCISQEYGAFHRNSDRVLQAECDCQPNKERSSGDGQVIRGMLRHGSPSSLVAKLASISSLTATKPLGELIDNRETNPLTYTRSRI